MPQHQTSPDNDLLAAIDLGSNSFHMIIARVEHGEVRPVERFAEKVQLAANMKNGKLQEDAMARGLDCLARFRQALAILQPTQMRMVGTNALRAAKNARDFTNAARAAIGRSVEVISGREEARLIYLGVAHTLADDDQVRLVVDIGGGSTEFVIGQRFEARLTESLHMGCVSYRNRFFANGKTSKKSFDKAYLEAYREVLNIRDALQALGWNSAVGSSGTLLAIPGVLAAQGWNDANPDEQVIVAKGLRKLRKLLQKTAVIDELPALANLGENRRSVFVPGVAITCALFDALGLEEMRLSTGALREGVIYDMIGRRYHEDVRERTVNAMMLRYAVDEKNARRVEEMALHLFNEVAAPWQLEASDRQLLVWAARLHEVGLAIAHNGFHKHGQYLLAQSDLPGFSNPEQRELALLVRSHRQKIPAAEFNDLSEQRMKRLCILLRLSVLFKYVTPVDGMPVLRLAVNNEAVQLEFPPNWLQRHPLTQAELKKEAQQVTALGYKLAVMG